ncbi:histidinol-phosphatase (PHP family) [Bacillus ectoiniformans]|uniref:histidinol-phosphatase HisJ n=1 Tax=Bacillus ectoiniformans TaxID=1494429 RepID=UPI00195681E4|nr:histidinol-phosphatase HisJ [Bacillus ectoiniformans]MBM7648806.1 histidinol-phosphatase (PHP family) [Bacillus ectoiniformans]
MKRDGHIHTPYCPHGTSDSFESYIEEAIEQGYQQLTFTEHAPLPEGFVDSTPTKDSGMKRSLLDSYVSALQMAKKNYQNEIDIKIGLEVDYIEGFERETTEFLNEYGPLLDDSILSVHFLKKGDSWHCMDYSAELFEEMIHLYGSATAIYETYFHTVAQSIKADLGIYKPKRIGHITLVHKFQHRFPCEKNFTSELRDLLLAIKEKGYELDYNGAGAIKPLCQEAYPPIHIAQEAYKLGIPLVYGSDAHQAKDIGQGRSKMDLSLLNE